VDMYLFKQQNAYRNKATYKKKTLHCMIVP